MKKVILTFVTVILTIATIYAQAPQSFKYQAVARDNAGNVLNAQSISIRISIHESNPGGAVVYSEEFVSISTNQFGLFNLEIGTGAVISGVFSTINWGGNLHFVEIEMDAVGGTTYLPMGTSQLLSVPYALFSENTANVDDADADSTNELQAISISNDTIYLSNGGFVVLPPDQTTDADADPTNELQAISISNDTLLLSSGGTVYLGNYLDNTDNQTLSLTGDTLSISNGNNVILVDDVNDADADPTNELQVISISNDTIYLSNGGFVVLPPDQTTDADADPTNELQVISISNDTLLLSNGGSVYLGNYLDNTDNQTLSLTGDTLSISNGNNVILVDDVNDADADSTNELQVLSFANDTLFLSNGNYVLMPYDSAIWTKNGDTIYYNTGNVGIGTNNPGTARLAVMGGNVGIGTTSPATKLEVNGSIQIPPFSSGKLQIGRPSGSGGDEIFGQIEGIAPPGVAGGLLFRTWDGSSAISRMYITYLGNIGIGDATPDGKFEVRQTGTADIFNLYDGATNVFTVVDGGNVGIGATNPGQPLDVSGDVEVGGGSANNDGTDEFISIRAQSENWYIGVRNLATPANSDFHIGLTQAQDGIFHIQPDGNVGIGTTNPNSKLQVTNGDVYVQTQGNGIILRDTDGAGCHRITVNTAGTITATVVACP